MIFFPWCMQGCFVSQLQRVSRVKLNDAGHLDHSSRARIARTCLALAQWCGCHRWKGAAVEERVRCFFRGCLFCCWIFVKGIPFQFVMKEMQMHYIQRIMCLGTGFMCTISRLHEVLCTVQRFPMFAKVWPRDALTRGALSGYVELLLGSACLPLCEIHMAKKYVAGIKSQNGWCGHFMS